MEINKQPIEKADRTGFLSVHSIFPTIQGEGPFTGRPCVFLRLAGCNLQCPGCDTEYTLGRSDNNLPEAVAKSVMAMAENAFDAHTARLVVITGGEPFRQDIRGLVNALINAGYQVQLETNGSLWLEGMPYGNKNLTIVCSPKTGKIHPLLERHVDYFKYVVKYADVSFKDGLPMHALDHTAPASGVARPLRSFPKENIYINPMDEKDDARNARNLRTAIRSCMDFGYTLGLQVHKIINMP